MLLHDGSSHKNNNNNYIISAQVAITRNRSTKIIKTSSFMHRYPFLYTLFSINRHTLFHPLNVILSSGISINLVMYKSVVKSLRDILLKDAAH